VPCSSLFKTVAVRCGHCASLLSVNLRDLLLPAANDQLLFGQALLSPTSPHGLFVRISFFGDNLHVLPFRIYILSVSILLFANVCCVFDQMWIGRCSN
jgi:hypothetical protein